jgi:hypothetical protein
LKDGFFGNYIFCSENALKISYSSVEFKKFSEGGPQDFPFKGREGTGKGKNGREGGKAGEGPEWDP